MRKKPLTAVQLETARAIYRMSKRDGFPPSFRGLADELGVCIGTIQARIGRLTRFDVIKPPMGHARLSREILFTSEFKQSEEYRMFKSLG